MLYDCFLISNEIECLEIRMAELYELPVLHIAVQANKTFTNKPKQFEELLYENLICVNVTDMPDGNDNWARERHQRNSIMRGLEACNPKDDDLVIIADVDEIVNAEAVKQYKPEMGVTALVMDKMGYWLNCREGKQSWKIAKICTYADLKRLTPDQVRNNGQENYIEHGGFHFSYLGGADKVLQKFQSFSHQELNIDKWANPERIKKYIMIGHSLWSDEPDDLWDIIPIDNTFPKYVQEHQHDTLKHLIHD